MQNDFSLDKKDHVYFYKYSINSTEEKTKEKTAQMQHI